jgi:two-component system response regulator AtoC
MKNHHSFKVFIVEDDVWYGSMLQHYLSLNPEYEVNDLNPPAIFLPNYMRIQKL